MELTQGKIMEWGTKTILAGVAGIGKTTLASQAPGAIILDVEDGSSLLDVKRTPVPKSWDELISFLRDLYSNSEAYGLKTLVIDTIDKAEALATQSILDADPKHPATIEQACGGYGKGYVAVAKKMEGFTTILDSFRAKGINVILIAHDTIQHIDNPDTLQPYDTYTVNLSKKSRPILVAWADSVLYMVRDVTTITTDSSKQKAVRAKRVIVTSSTPAYPDCKNRFNLPERVDADYENIKEVFKQ